MQDHHITQSQSSIAKWLSYIESLHTKSIDMGLDRISQVAARLDVFRPASFVFIVTGTNGKSTTCRILESVLMAAGYKVGVYSSPHLMSYTERVRIQNTQLSESVHIDSFHIIEKARNNIALTFFEFSTLSALWILKQEQVDIAILEVGLGGRLDATNIVDADVAVITNIEIDHTNWLGLQLENIAYEKAGIFRSGKPAVVGKVNIPQTIIQIAHNKNAQLLLFDMHWSITINDTNWHFEDIRGRVSNLPLPYMYQLNTAIALAAIRASNLKVSNQAIHTGIICDTLPGRFQIINQLPRIILDVAHNPHAAVYLASRLRSLPNIKRVLAIVGMLRDKDIAGTLACMNNIVHIWYCASLHEPRGANVEQLAKYINQGKIYIYTTVEEAWYSAISIAKPEDTILVYGSFYTVAHVMKIIEQ